MSLRGNCEKHPREHKMRSSSAHRHGNPRTLYIFETSSSMRIFWWYFHHDWLPVRWDIWDWWIFQLIIINIFSEERSATVWSQAPRCRILIFFGWSFHSEEAAPKSWSACWSHQQDKRYIDRSTNTAFQKVFDIFKNYMIFWKCLIFHCVRDPPSAPGHLSRWAAKYQRGERKKLDGTTQPVVRPCCWVMKNQRIWEEIIMRSRGDRRGKLGGTTHPVVRPHKKGKEGEIRRYDPTSSPWRAAGGKFEEVQIFRKSWKRWRLVDYFGSQSRSGHKKRDPAPHGRSLSPQKILRRIGQ